jgi:DNA-binding GntR family transcriptional regulator
MIEKRPSDDLRIIPNSVQLQVLQKLRTAILNGTFLPGERLIEAELCTRIAVSRASIREALRRLEAEKLVTSTLNKGTSVTMISWEEAEELYDTRALLEGEAAYRCAKFADKASVAAMYKALDAFDNAVEGGDVMGWVLKTQEFYETLHASCANRIIKELLEGLSARISFMRARSMTRHGRAIHSGEEMRRMLEAIERHDCQGARTAAHEHVKRAREAAQEVYGEIESRV